MKIDCEIVQDLIPSYLEELCSDASRRCVEEHIAECEECRTFVKSCREVGFTAKAMEEKQLDGLRKLKTKIKLQTMVSYGLMLAVLLLGTYNFTANSSLIEPRWYYVLFAVALAATYAATMQQASKPLAGKKRKLLFLLSIVSIVYGITMYGVVMGATMQDNVPFGLEVAKVGPFLHTQTGIAFAIEIAVFGYAMVRYIKKDEMCRSLLLVNLTGIFLILAHTSLLGCLSDFETYLRDFSEITAVMIGISAVSGLVMWGLERRKQFG